MHFVHEIFGVKIKISLISSSQDSSASVSCVRLVDDRVEMDVSKFSGAIVISRIEDSNAEDCSHPRRVIGEWNEDGEIVVDAIPEDQVKIDSSLMRKNAFHYFVDSTFEDNKVMRSKADRGNFKKGCVKCGSVFEKTSKEWIEGDDKFKFHEGCASSNLNIGLLRQMLRESDNKLASVPDDEGNFPVQIFASNPSVASIAVEGYQEVEDFFSDLHSSFPSPFHGEVHEIPFVAVILEWIGEYHQQFMDGIENREMLSAIDAAKETTTRLYHASSQSAEKDIRSFSLSQRVVVTSKFMNAIKLLSRIVEDIVRSALDEYYGDAEKVLNTKPLDEIVGKIASVPYLLRTIIVIDDDFRDEKNEIIDSSLLKHILLSTRSVGQWVITMMCGNSFARKNFVAYLKLVSSISLERLLGVEKRWSASSQKWFCSHRTALFEKMSSIKMFLSCATRMGDDLLLEAASTEVVVYQIDKVLGEPLAIGMILNDAILHFILMISYRAVLKTVNSPFITDPPAEYQELWILGILILTFFIVRDSSTLIATIQSSKYALFGHVKHLWNWIIVACILMTFSIFVKLINEPDFYAPNYMAITSGFLWLKALYHIKGMNEHVATLMYTVSQIFRKMLPFLFILVFVLVMFSDMIEIVTKATGGCEPADDTFSDDDPNFCEMGSIDNYMLMYTYLLTGIDFSLLHNSSPFVRLLLLSFTFLGIIILTNVLIAVVTDCYGDAGKCSRALFQRSRLQIAARHDTRNQFFHPPTFTTARDHFIMRSFIKFLLFSSLVVINYFLVISIDTLNELVRRGVVEMFLQIDLIACAILFDTSLIGTGIHFFSASLGKHTKVGSLSCVIRFKRNKAFIIFTKICLLPLDFYLSMIGLKKNEEWSDSVDLNL